MQHSQAPNEMQAASNDGGPGGAERVGTAASESAFDFVKGKIWQLSNNAWKKVRVWTNASNHTVNGTFSIKI
jgi:hypothetical protein